MAMDGSITISTKLDNSGLKTDTSKLETAFRKFGAVATNALSGSSKSVMNIRQKIVETNIAIEETQRQMREIEETATSSGDVTSKAYESAKTKVEQTRIALGNLESKMAEIAKTAAKDTAEFYPNPSDHDEAVAKVLETDKAYQKLGEQFDSLLVKLKQQNEAVLTAQSSAISSSGTQSNEYKRLDKNLSSLGTRLDQYNSRLSHTEMMSKKTNLASKSLGSSFEKLKNRISRLMIGVLVFNVLRKGLTQLRNHLDATKKANAEFSKSLSQIKGNLLIAFQPIYEAVLPQLLRFVDWLKKATAYIAVFTSALVGKTVKQSAIAAKNLNAQAQALKSIAKTAKEASGALAGFDEINQVAAGGVASGVDLPDVDFAGYQVPESVTVSIKEFADKVKETWNWITKNEPAVSLSLGLFGIALLGVFGPNMISKIAGFIFLYKGVGKIIEAVGDILETGEINWKSFMKLLSGAGLAVLGLGLILGSPKVAGFGLILWGMSEAFRGLTDMIHGNGDEWKNFQRVVVGVAAIVGGAFILLGWQVGLIALAVGALTLGIVYLAQNWDKLSPAQRTITILGGLAAAAIAAAVAIAVFHTAWSVGIAAAAIAGGLAILAGTYLFTQHNAKPSLSSGGGSGGGIRQAQSFGALDFSRSPIPKLATGAVIPANKEFVAILGDQRHGKNIEAPEGLLRDIIRDELGKGEDGDIILNARIELDDCTVVGRVNHRVKRGGWNHGFI